MLKILLLSVLAVAMIGLMVPDAFAYLGLEGWQVIDDPRGNFYGVELNHVEWNFSPVPYHNYETHWELFKEDGGVGYGKLFHLDKSDTFELWHTDFKACSEGLENPNCMMNEMEEQNPPLMN